MLNSVVEMTALIHAMPFAHMVIDEDSVILSVSHAIEALSGYDALSLHGQPLSLLIPSDAPHPHFQSLTIYAGDEMAKPLKPLSDVPLLRKDGTIVRVSVERYIYSFDGRRRFGGVVRLLQGDENGEPTAG